MRIWSWFCSLEFHIYLWKRKNWRNSLLFFLFLCFPKRKINCEVRFFSSTFEGCPKKGIKLFHLHFLFTILWTTRWKKLKNKNRRWRNFQTIFSLYYQWLFANTNWYIALNPYWHHCTPPFTMLYLYQN